MTLSDFAQILRRHFALRLAAVLGVMLGLLAGLSMFVRPWYLGWGATPSERVGPLPGDHLSRGPINATRAIDIEAPAPVVFAWVSQLGQNRGGFYSYTALENLVGCRMPDVRQLDPALQRWKVGDRLWMYPPDALEGMGHATLLLHEPGRALVFGTNSPLDPPGTPPTGLWSFAVEPRGDHSARLLVRGSGGLMPSLLGRTFNRTVFEPLHFAMERRMLEGIRGLAESQPITRASDSLQLLCWATTFALFMGSAALVLLGQRPLRRLLGFAAAGAVFQVLTLVQPMPLISVGLVLLLAVLIWPTPGGAADPASDWLEQDT